MKPVPDRAAPLALLAVPICLPLGGGALWLGVSLGAIAFWGFGAACLLQVPPALSLRRRILDGLGNAGLERERLTLKTVSFLLRLLALGLGLASGMALFEGGSTQTHPASLIVAVAALGLLVPLWVAKQGLRELHPALDLDAARTRTLVGLAGLLLVGCLLGRWFPWADAASGLVFALGLFLEGRSLAKATTLQAACGGCGSGCGCG
jgi:hypothetical protein